MLYFVFILLVTLFNLHTSIDARSVKQDVVHQIVNGPINSDKDHSIDLANFRHRVKHSPNLNTFRWALKHQYDAATYCEACNLLVPVTRLIIENNQTEQFRHLALNLCKEFGLLDIDVCVGAIYEYWECVIEVIGASSLTSRELCALALDCENQSDFPKLNWNITVPGRKPPPRPPQPPSPESPKLTVLHLSDIHVDFGYKPGSQAECFQPVCCRFGQPLPSETGAGFWGDYRGCDLPYWTAEAMFQHIAAVENNIDFVYYTGDLPPHNVWNQSRADQIYTINTMNDLLAKIFPNKTFYSTVGNHEAAPSELFPTPLIPGENISWLYEVLASSWIKLGLPINTRDSILHGAFYTTVIRPGLRLISLNMNYCSPQNFWLLINATDPLDQLQWLVQWLQYAEDHEEKVHIIGHHPPRFCLAAFSWNFNRIVNRYENTIAGQFYGHTHYDEFNMFYDEVDSNRPVSMAYITPSLSPRPFSNPSYRIYTMDGNYSGSSYWVLDHRTVIMNLTASNMYNRTIIQDEYEARDAYQMKNLFPNDWNDLIDRLKNDIDGPLMSSIYKHYTKSYKDGSQCDHECRRKLLCDFKTARSDDPHICDSIPPFVDS
ncbi:unnamed protein product [Rotaria socialis]|uniref:Sphingomyelin phosphodiesterase n=1 Tax=Rotaria socialis TaxID=392032 RepID=A0A821HPH8_9BILA|nr:unnamed protein product [Rotaria socialis]